MNITNISIFGHYKKDEDRVTSALLKILSKGGTQFISDVMNDLVDNWNPYNGIQISTQTSNKTKKNVYDGLLQSNFLFDLIIESKIKKSAVQNGPQLANLSAEAKNPNTFVLYITPDNTRPKSLQKSNISWCSWDDVVKSLQNHNTQEEPLNYMIEQFVMYITDLKLLSSVNAQNTVLIVAGGFGRNIALKYNFYACQNNRTGRPAKYLAFYTKWKIQEVFEIEQDYPEVDCKLTKRKDIGTFIKDYDPPYKNDDLTFFKLKKLSYPIDVTHSGKFAFTMGQFRYTTIDKLRNAKTTDDLL